MSIIKLYSKYLKITLVDQCEYILMLKYIGDFRLLAFNHLAITAKMTNTFVFNFPLVGQGLLGIEGNLFP